MHDCEIKIESYAFKCMTVQQVCMQSAGSTIIQTFTVLMSVMHRLIAASQPQQRTMASRNPARPQKTDAATLHCGIRVHPQPDPQQ